LIKLKYGLALSSCYLLAVAKLYNVPALFQHIEREMESIVAELRREVSVLFLSEF